VNARSGLPQKQSMHLTTWILLLISNWINGKFSTKNNTAMNKVLQYKIATDYWLEKTAIPALSEITATTMATGKSGSQSQSFLLDDAMAATLKKICNRQDAAMYAFFSVALYIFIHKYTAAEDILIASPSPGLPGDEPSSSPLFLSAAVHKDSIIRQLLQAFQEELKEAYRHKDYSFEKFSEKYATLVGPTASLFNYALSYVPLTGAIEYGEACKLSFTIDSTPASFSLTIQHSHHYASWFVTQMGTHWQRILHFIINNPAATVAAVPLLSVAEKQLLTETFNDTAIDFPEKDLTVLALFEKKAQLHPQQVAVEFAGKQVTYHALQQRALTLATQLKAKGIGAKDVVALVCDRSEHMITGMLGILKTGAAYLPVDADFPDERIHYILKDSSAKLILTTKNVLAEKQACFSKETSPVILLDDITPQGDAVDFFTINDPGDPAYIIYTSGSTGQPKGIVVKQSGVTNFVLAYKCVFEKGFNTTDRLLALSNISFDASIAEIFVALTSGATLVVLDKARLFDAASLATFLVTENITGAYIPPVLLKDLYTQLQQQAMAIPLRKMLVGVEPIKDTLLYDYCTLIPELDIINAYGPAETTVASSAWRYKALPPTGENVSIGQPLPNYRIYILNEDLELVPVGVPGEICIAGPGVSQGYLNNDALTAVKFVADPFYKGQPMFRSGDLAKWTPEGNIVFIGRKDHQVKIHGYRIEPDEIAAALQTHPAVKEAVVSAFDDGMGSKYLCAYIVPSADVTITDIVTYLSLRLPEYMIPSRFMMLDKMPVTSNGKTDRRKLPRPENEQRILGEEDKPATAIEANLVTIWKEILNLPQIGINDNFFALGGHSLKAARLITVILQELQVEVPLRQVFSSGTIKQLAAYIQHAGKTVQFNIPLAPLSTTYPAAFAQRGIYLSYLLDKTATNYNMPTVFSMEGEIDIPKLETAFKTVIARQAALRTGFSFSEEQMIQHVAENVPFEIPVKQDTAPDIHQYVTNFVQPFDLSKPPLLRALLIEKNANAGLLLLDMHHIISDGISMNIFLEELLAVYSANTLPPLKIQYKDYAAWLETYSSTKAFDDNKQYWLETFTNRQIALDLPLDYPRSHAKKPEGALHVVAIAPETANRLQQIVNTEGSSIFLLTMAAYHLLLAAYTGQKHIIVGTAVAGRVHPDLDHLMGMFVNTLPIKCSVDMQLPFTQLMAQLRETFFTALDHQLYPMEELVEELQLVRDVNKNPLFDTMFGYHNMAIHSWATGHLSLTPLAMEMKEVSVKFDLSASIVESGGEMQLLFNYSKNLFKKSTIEKMMAHYLVILETVAANPSVRMDTIDLGRPADNENSLSYDNQQQLFEYLGIDENTYESAYPLNTTQRDIYLTCLLHPEGFTLRPLGYYEITEEITVPLWEEAIKTVTRQEEILRSALITKDAEVFQCVKKEINPRFHFSDISGEVKDAGDIYPLIKKYCDENQDIHQPPFKHYLFRVKQDHYVTAVSAHHIFTDGTSFKLLAEKVDKAYHLLKEGKVSTSTHRPFRQDVFDHLARFDTPVIENFWRQQLSEVQPLAYSGTLPGREAIVADVLTIAGEEAAMVNSYCKEHGIKPHVFFKAIFTLLAKYYCTADHDFCIRENIAGRSQQQMDTLGIYSHVFPLLIAQQFFHETTSFPEFCAYLQQQKRAANPYRYISLALQNHIIGEEPLSFFYNYQHYLTPVTKTRMSALKRVYNILDNHVELRVLEQEASFELKIDYDEKIFNGENYLNRVHHILTQVLTQNKPLRELQFVTAPEQEQLNAFGHNPGNKAAKNVLELFEIHVKEKPESIAIVFRDKNITYAELNRLSDNVAAHLQAQGAMPEDIIGIMVERSEWMVISMLGVLKAGAAYLPLDPEYPLERIAYLLSDSNAKMMMTDAACKNRYPSAISIEEIAQKTAILIKKAIAPQQLAYVIYTSGTTGRPKGVMVEHQALSNIAEAWRVAYQLDTFEVRMLQMASFSFDVFTGDVVRTITNGDRMIICPSETRLDPKSLYELLSSHQINFFESTPALIAPLMEYTHEHQKDISFLRLLVLGSDTCLLTYFRKLMERYAPGIRVLNSYGVTETCVDSGFYETSLELLPATGNTPIGKPLLNYTYYVCNTAHQLVPAGVPGELWIGGHSVARGYLNRPDITAEKFIIHPHNGERVYKTGDIVRWLSDGNIEFLGRKDDQVKVRGYRIELQEIESILLREPAIKEVVITVFGQEDEKELICWYASQSGEALSDLKDALKQQLPDYMVPAHFILLPHLPVTPNGKIDKKALQDPLKYIDHSRTITAVPATATETTLLRIWQDILKRNNIGVLDHFFELGGQSLRAMVLVSRIQKTFAADISLKDIFLYPTIRSLAHQVDNALSNRFVPIPRISRQAHYPLSSAQKRVFVINHFKGAEISHNMWNGHWILGSLDVPRLEKAFQSLINRHESLRTSFSIENGEPVQIIHDKIDFHLKHTCGEEEDTPAAVAAFIRKFELSEAPLLRAAIWEVNPEKYLLLFDMHHIIGDEVSMGTFFRELWETYDGATLPEPAVQYKDYVAWQQSLFNTGVMSQQKQYWMQQLEGELPVMELPFDFPRPLSQTFEGGDHAFKLDEVTASRVLQFVSEKGVTLNMLLLAVYNILLSKYTSLEDIIVGTPVAGRTHADLERVMGMFVNTLAIRSYPAAEKKFDQFLEEIKINALSAYENQDYPFEELVEALQIKRNPGRTPLFDTLFQFISKQNSEENHALTFAHFPPNISVAKFDLTFLGVQTGEHIEFVLNYNSGLFTPASIQRMAKHFYNILVQIITTPAIPLQQISLLDEEEIQVLKTFGGSPEKNVPAVTIPGVWQEQALQQRSQTAVTTSKGSLTFEALDQQSTALAIYLQEVYHVKPGEKIALMLQRTLDMPVTLLAILKTGAAYVPVDPNFPVQRIEYILGNSGCNMIVADKDYNFSLPVFNIYGERKPIGQQELTPVAITPADLAYIIYTSGSTGVPKGAMLEHGNVTGFTRNFGPVYGIVPGDKILAISNITFDLSVLEILCSLLSGVSVLLADDDEINDFPKIEKMIREHQVNVLQMTPSRLSLFVQTVGLGIIGSVKTVITGGEPVPAELFNALRRHKNTRIFTSCGPTETCIYSTTDEVKDDKITIGKPLLNEQILIISNHGQMQPINVVGEIYVAGSGVGRGYCNQEALTNEKYFRDEKLSSQRIYKSGDIGRWLADGRIECLGRKDTQIKLRGYRIELGEIENALAKMEGIGMTAAIVTTIKGEKQIAAFYESDREYGYSTIRTFLADRLPSYMLPLFCIYVPKMPLTTNGKTDKKALEQLAQQQDAAEKPFEEATSPLQKTLAAIWKEVLRVDRVGVTDNFFEIGGNSIKLIQVLNRVKKELEINIPLTTAFTYPTIKALAEKIKMLNEFGSVSAEEFYSVVNAGKPQTIFCFPPAIGYSFIYTALAEYFPHHSICCFHFHEHENRLEQYMDVMNEMQPDQPLLLLGYSAGGNFAFEIAKELEASGREVSDIILIDSFKRWAPKVKTPEELEATVQAYYDIVDWSIFSVDPDYLETLKRNTMSKIAGYCKYMNGKTDPGTTSARIHIVKSKQEWSTPETNRDWEESTTHGFHIHQGEGLHPEMFNPEYLSHNAGLISSIIRQVSNQQIVQQPSYS
jgi:amino acid adenylation domain-containing protein